jgi:hypothetical protein
MMTIGYSKTRRKSFEQGFARELPIFRQFSCRIGSFLAERQRIAATAKMAGSDFLAKFNPGWLSPLSILLTSPATRLAHFACLL